MGQAEDLLAAQLSEKQEEFEALRSEFEDYKDNERWRWARHKELPATQALPVPRLEIYLDEEQGDDYNRVWVYRMVHRHLLGHCVAIPLGQTSQTGGRRITEQNSPLEFMPFRDGAHIRHDSAEFGWPAFMVFRNRVEQITLKD